MRDFKQLLKECHELGYLTDEFALACCIHADIQIAKKDLSYDPYIKAEAKSHFFYKLVRKWQKIDPAKSPFSYLNSMIYTSILDVSTRENLYHRKKAEFLNVVQGKLNIPKKTS